ncbi:uncharacterized protein [Oscarella lobularis]|uniref:uncharacterized protein n=1 Tax=Oscarella lobularis TaxID=121494 RepID=UPI0033135BD2
MDSYKAEYVHEKERQIEETMERIRQQLSAMRAQDAALRHQVVRMKRTIHHVAVEIRGSSASLAVEDDDESALASSPSSPLPRQRVGSGGLREHPRAVHRIHAPVACEDEDVGVAMRRRQASRIALKLSGSTGSICSYESSTDSYSRSMTDLTASRDEDPCSTLREKKRSSADSTESFWRRRESAFTSIRKAIRKIQRKNIA